MAVLSINQPFPIFTDQDGSPLELGSIFIGQANQDPQTNPIAVYFDPALTQSASQPIRTSSGFAVKNGAPANLYVNSDFSIRVKNKKNVTVFSAASVTERISGDVISSIEASKVSYLPSGTGAVETTAESIFSQTVSVKDYGAVGDGVTDDTDAFNDALTYLLSINGGCLYIPSGEYLLSGTPGEDGELNGILIPFSSLSYDPNNRIMIRGDGNASNLKAGSNNMNVVRIASSFNILKDISISGNGKTGVSAVSIIPEDVTQTSTRVDQNFNVVSNLYIQGVNKGYRFKTGPNVLGADSGCWYNRIENFTVFASTNGVHIDACQVGASSVNRNYFLNGRIGGAGSTNGVVINDGDTNVFNSVHVEGTALAYYIENVGTSGKACEYNKLIGCTLEGNTVGVRNKNAFTEIIGCELGSFASQDFVAHPLVILTGDPSVIPQRMLGETYFQASSQFANVGINSLTSNGFVVSEIISPGGSAGEAIDLGFNWGTYAISTSNTANIASVQNYESKFKSFGKFVDWHFRFNFQASSGSGSIDIELPTPPDLDLYRYFSTTATMTFFVVTSTTSGTGVSYGAFSNHSETLNGEPYIKIYPHAGNWVTASPSGQIQCMLRYRKAD